MNPREALTELAALADAELAMIRDGRSDELDELADRRTAVLALLPDQLDKALRPLLVDVLRRQGLDTVALQGAAGEARSALGTVDRERAGARGYAPPVPGRASVVDATG
jgi:hypothetical protein